jgi:very-short-patch-repair endonuclease/ribosomal protein S14
MQICTTEKTYTCECGKLFYNPQSFNGHKSHCKSHQLAKGGEQGLAASLDRQRNASKAAQAAVRAASRLKQESIRKAWIAEKHTCEKCGQLMLEKFGVGRFCSRACANSHVHSDETKQKIKMSLDATLLAQAKHVSRSKKVCSICGVAIKSVNKTGVCRYCLDNTPEGLVIKQALGRKGYQTKQERGTHVGWQSRNITSYAEKFWQNVLDSNNITYEREFLVNCNKTHYFLDFKLVCGDKLIDLEIDGKQHTYADRAESDLIRDTNLTGLGYLVYRIPWNEVNSDAGKAQMKQKIDDFLVFYNTCNKGG